MSRIRSVLALGAALAVGAMGCTDVAAPSRGNNPTQVPQTVAPVPPTWTVYDLGTLPGDTKSLAHDLNQSVAVGVSYNIGSLTDGRAVWWDSAQAIAPTTLGLGVPPGGVAAEARAINASGQVVGEFNDGVTTRGFVWTAGAGFTTLSGPPGAGSAHAYDINDAGTVVGVYYSGFTPRAFRYSQGGGYVDLHPAGMAGSFAFGVNNQGNVVGYVITSTNEYHAALWFASGPFVDLGGTGIPIHGIGNDINDNDNLVGLTGQSPTDYGFAQHTSGAMVILPGLSHAMAISSRNRIVGRNAATAATMRGLSGAVTSLPALAGATSSIALAANPCGSAVGWSNINGAYRATAWVISACD